MKTIPYVPPVAMTDHLGAPWPSATEQKTLTLSNFLLDQAASPGFAEPRRGLEQIEFSLAVRAAITATAPGAPLELEDAHHEALTKAVRQCQFSQPLVHNLLEFVKATLAGG